MKKLTSILLASIFILVMVACSSASSSMQKNEIAPATLSEEQQEIIDLLSVPNNQELMLFDFATDEPYRGLEVWVEVYQNGELIERPAGINTFNNIAEKRNGRIAIVISQNDNTYEWTISVVENGGRAYHVGTSEMPADFTGGRAYGPMDDSAAIENGKEIIIYSSTFMEANVPHQVYDEQTLMEQPEILSQFAYAQLIKCKFSN